jgi:hypothetical protein
MAARQFLEADFWPIWWFRLNFQFARNPSSDLVESRFDRLHHFGSEP